jgi:rubrerythrin
MIGKVKNSTRHLLCCVGLEVETFHLYQCVAKKMNQAELRSLVVNIAYDTMKHSETIRELLRTVGKAEVKVENCSKNWHELWKGIVEASEQISMMENISDEEFCEIFNSLAKLEDGLSESYYFLLGLKVHESLAKELGKLTPVNLEDLIGIFQRIIEDKQRHKDTLIGIRYRFAAKEAIRARDSAPVVRYQNPDAWNKQPT